MIHSPHYNTTLKDLLAIRDNNYISAGVANRRKEYSKEEVDALIMVRLNNQADRFVKLKWAERRRERPMLRTMPHDLQLAIARAERIKLDQMKPKPVRMDAREFFKQIGQL